MSLELFNHVTLRLPLAGVHYLQPLLLPDEEYLNRPLISRWPWLYPVQELRLLFKAHFKEANRETFLGGQGEVELFMGGSDPFREVFGDEVVLDEELRVVVADFELAIHSKEDFVDALILLLKDLPSKHLGLQSFQDCNNQILLTFFHLEWWESLLVESWASSQVTKASILGLSFWE